MNDHFEPGEGWREINEREWLQTPIDSDCVDSIIDGRHRRWVREVPVPPLPTALWTVILLHGDLSAEGLVWILCPGIPENLWFKPGWKLGETADGLRSAQNITGFEVLAEPGDARFSERAIRKATAKAVLDRVRERIAGHVQPGFEMRPDGTEDPESAGYVAGLDSALGHVEFIAREFGVES